MELARYDSACRYAGMLVKAEEFFSWRRSDESFGHPKLGQKNHRITLFAFHSTIAFSVFFVKKNRAVIPLLFQSSPSSSIIVCSKPIHKTHLNKTRTNATTNTSHWYTTRLQRPLSNKRTLYNPKGHFLSHSISYKQCCPI